MKRIALLSCVIGFCLMILTGCGADSVDLSGGSYVPTPDPTETPVVMATVRGTITDDSGVPLAGVSVAIAGITTVTDANGNYTLEVPTGETVISVQMDGYEDLRQNITVVEGENTLSGIGMTKKVMSPETIKGTVTSSSGTPIPGAIINVSNPGGDQVATATTNEFGNYVIESVTAGLYTVNISAFAYNQIVQNNVETTVTGPTTLNVTLSPASSFKFYTDNETLKLAGAGGNWAYTPVSYPGITMQQWIQNATLFVNQEWYDKWTHHADFNGEYGPVTLPDPTADYLIRLGGFAELAVYGASSGQGLPMYFKPVLSNANPPVEIQTIITQNGLPLNNNPFAADVTYPNGMLLSDPVVFVPIYPFSVNTRMASQPVLDGHYRVFYDIRGDHSRGYSDVTVDGTTTTTVAYTPSKTINHLTKWNPYAIAGTDDGDYLLTQNDDPYEAGTGIYYNLCLWFPQGPQSLTYEQQAAWAGFDVVTTVVDSADSSNDSVTSSKISPTWDPQTISQRPALPNYFKVPVKSGQKLTVKIMYAYYDMSGVDLDIVLYDENLQMIDSTRGVSDSTETLSRVAPRDTFYIVEVKNFLPTLASYTMTGIPYAMQITKDPEDANRAGSDLELPASRMSNKANIL